MQFLKNWVASFLSSEYFFDSKPDSMETGYMVYLNSIARHLFIYQMFSEFYSQKFFEIEVSTIYATFFLSFLNLRINVQQVNLLQRRKGGAGSVAGFDSSCTASGRRIM